MAGTPPSSVRGGFPLGLAGAVSPTRYVGGTADLAPTTGTFSVGDFVVSATAKIWVCTVAGTPGTWVQAGGGGAATKDFVSVAAPVSITATSEGTAQAIVQGNSLVWDGTTRYVFEVASPTITMSSAGTTFSIILYDGTTTVGYYYSHRTPVAAQAQGNLLVRVPITPPAGTRAYSFRGFSGAANTVTIAAGAGGVGADGACTMIVTPA